ncbi:hypothetical protein [Subtercola boreus]|nr:hypothetical protein [Subtercola boreus]
MDTSGAADIAKTFQPVGTALHAFMPKGVSLAADMMRAGGLDRQIYRTQYVHNIVACTHSLLTTAELGDWVLDPRASKKQLHLSRDLWTVRMLSVTFDGTVPLAGTNGARQGFYSNQPVLLAPGQQVFHEQHGFLIVWNLDRQSGEIGLELVHTLMPWKMGQAEQIDLRMPLLPGEADLATLRFVPSNDDDLDGLGLIDARGRFQRGVRNDSVASS